MAAKAALRPFQTRARSASDCATRISEAALARQISLTCVHEGFDFGYGAVEFHEQEPAAIRVVGVDGGFGGLNGEIVHHFDGGGEHAGGDDAADGGACFVGGVEGGEQRLHAFGALDDAEGDFRGDAESAFGADEDAEEIVAEWVDAFCRRGGRGRRPGGRLRGRGRAWW